MTGRLAEVLARAEALYYDVDLRSVVEWRSKHERKVIGFLPIYVPREIIHAAGMLPVGIVGGSGQLEIIRGDAYFQSYICQLPRSTIELALSGRLDSIDGFLFPSTCDVIRNLSGMWKILFPEKWVRYFDVPQNFDSAVGGRFYEHELRTIREELERLGGAPISNESLSSSIRAYNENRARLRALADLRSRAPWKAPASEAYLVVRAGNLLPIEEHTALLDAYLAEVETIDRVQRDHTRVVTVGSFCEQPPLDLIKTLEMAGCYIVWDDMQLGHHWLTSDVSPEGDPIHALTDAFLHHSTKTAARYEPQAGRGEYLVELTRRVHAEGVVLAAPSFCDPALLEQPMLQDALDRKKVPWTAFKYAENLGQFQVIREQAGTFADSVKLWSET